MIGATGTPVDAAANRGAISLLRTPSEIHSVGLSGSPLSKTEVSRPDEPVTTKGAVS